MKKIAALCIAALGAALLVLGTTPSASAYPDLSCDVSVNHQVVKPGHTFTATGRASGVDASNQVFADSDLRWTFRWNGVTKHRTGHLVTATFTAPHVTKSRKITLTGRVVTPSGTCVRHIVITVASSSVSAPGGGGGLPNTGGPAFWLLVAALVLLLAGAGTVLTTRRRN
jgi:LPXTG-motif cell wall-anchored protein